MKRDILMLMEKGTRDITIETKYIKEKLVTILVEIAKRDWPQRWPDLLQVYIKFRGVKVILFNIGFN